MQTALNASALVLTTNASDSGTKWSFHKYQGNVYEGVGWRDFDDSLALNETFTYNAYMRSTRIGHNGPVSYRVMDTDKTETARATINASTGVLTTYQYGKIRIQITYSGAPWVWYYFISIGGTFVDEVPTNIASNDNHKCIPCAITNVAAFWCIKNGLTQFSCATAAEQEIAAADVQDAMNEKGIVPYGAEDNRNIQIGFDCFSHTENGVTYTLQATGYEKDAASWELLVSEINAGRPVMLGFALYNTGAHSTVCVGYTIENGERKVFVSDAHENRYVQKNFDNQNNDFIATVSLVAN